MSGRASIARGPDRRRDSFRGYPSKSQSSDAKANIVAMGGVLGHDVNSPRRRVLRRYPGLCFSLTSDLVPLSQRMSSGVELPGSSLGVGGINNRRGWVDPRPVKIVGAMD